MKRVLIADDELHICNLIKCLIDWEAYGLEVAGFAHDGETAFQMCQELLPSFLITDIRMPGLNGLELMKKWGIPEGWIARCFVTLGYCEGGYPSPKERRAGRIKIIEQEEIL